MKIYANKWFVKFMQKENIPKDALIKAIDDINAGKIDADYGSGVFKQRIARSHEGKSGGYRSIILCRQNERAFFVYGFAKNQRENITTDEVKAFKNLAHITLNLTPDDINHLLTTHAYQEITS